MTTDPLKAYFNTIVNNAYRQFIRDESHLNIISHESLIECNLIKFQILEPLNVVHRFVDLIFRGNFVAV